MMIDSNNRSAHMPCPHRRHRLHCHCTVQGQRRTKNRVECVYLTFKDVSGTLRRAVGGEWALLSPLSRRDGL
eukprot:scaffold614_cov157-Ochromonas_danica.AAC.12